MFVILGQCQRIESQKAADDCQNKEKMSEFREPLIVP